MRPRLRVCICLFIHFNRTENDNLRIARRVNSSKPSMRLRLSPVGVVEVGSNTTDKGVYVDAHGHPVRSRIVVRANHDTLDCHPT